MERQLAGLTRRASEAIQELCSERKATRHGGLEAVDPPEVDHTNSETFARLVEPV